MALARMDINIGRGIPSSINFGRTRPFTSFRFKYAPIASTARAVDPAVETFGSVPLGSDFVLSNGMVDYYQVLGIDDMATDDEIKSAYRSLAKLCHPDISGDERGHNMCILLNEAYSVLSDANQRLEYNRALDEALTDEEDGFSGESLSKWCANTKFGRNTDPAESRAVFVDELTCIGCKQCIWCAPATFRIEDAYGRSRVFAQWVDTEDNIQAAMDACPVSCIHWVEREDLPALEHVTRHKVNRVSVGAMMSGQGGAVTDVWDATTKFLKGREERKKARERAAKYSRAQAVARAAAAEELIRQQQGWFSQLADKLGITGATAWAYAAAEASTGGGSSEDELASYRRVGKRRRNRRPDPEAYGARGENGGGVPAERALVPVSASSSKPWQR